MKKKSKTGLAGKAKRITALALAGCILYCGGMQANAATLKDVFDEHYYADTYPDLKEVYGYNREALWQHFTTHGLSEGRNMNGLIDIVKYREMYSDLDTAFGDNWNAYLNHYLTFGAKENRETGTDFNALDYAGRYEDLQTAYGTNVLALWNHYRTSGAAEGREARDESILQAEEDAARATEETEEAVAKAEESGETQDSLIIVETKVTERHDNGMLKTVIGYSADGSKVSEAEFNNHGFVLKETKYSKDGSYIVIEYGRNMTIKQMTEYNADGTIKK